MPKRSLREQLLRFRDALPPEQALQQAAAIQRRFVTLPEFAHAMTVALYSPVRGEVATSDILRQVLDSGKIALFPRLAGEHLDFMVLNDLADLRPGRFGIPEPQTGRIVPLAEIDLMAVPGVAFDRSGHRLGYGKGYYDRLLQRRGAHCRLAGLAYDQQLLEQFPAEGHDVRMDLILTAAEELRFEHTPSFRGASSPSKGGY